MFRLVLLSVAMTVAMAAPSYIFDPELDSAWQMFKGNFEKVYDTNQEESFRRMVFEKNVRFIRDHNMQADLGMRSFTVGLNEYADLTTEEFAKRLTGFRPRNQTSGSTFIAPSNLELPTTVDWRPKGYVTPVKNQLQCGSCWAFSATGSLEGQTFKKTHKLVSLSEQNLVDCSTKQGNMGCMGGLMDQAFQYIKQNGGIDTEASYPYEAQDGKCRFDRNNVGAKCTGYTDIRSGDEKALQKAVASVGPISVAIDASHQSFQLYKTGVYYERECSTTLLDHGVLAVGYGSEGGDDYWLVKNSWGASWGQKGYLQMSRNRNNNCGIATQASYPLV